MTTETVPVLTDEQIVACGSSSEINGPYSFARAIEQAVLQSPEIQALRKDAERYRAIRAASGSDDGVFRAAMFDYACENFTNPGRPTADEYDGAIDAAIRGNR